MRRQVPGRLRRAVAARDVRGQGAIGCEGRADPFASQPGPSQKNTTPSCWTFQTTPIRSRQPTPTTTEPPSRRRRPIPTGFTTSKRTSTAIMSKTRRRLTILWTASFRVPTATNSILVSTPATRSTGINGTRMVKSTLRAWPKAFLRRKGS